MNDRMCSNKASFTNKAKAKAVAEKYGQRVYECPVCFCWHTTSQEKWHGEYVTRTYMEREIAKLRTENNQKVADLNNQIHIMQIAVKQQRELIKTLRDQRDKAGS